jgi:(p)ppGpp synthase/HD superfamily hydrolase
VAETLWKVGVRDIPVIVAAILHDTVEDTETTLSEIKEQFGPAVRSLVQEVTDDKSLPKPERKRLQVEHAPHLSKGAQQIKLADKISNITSRLSIFAISRPIETGGAKALSSLSSGRICGEVCIVSWRNVSAIFLS